MADKDTCPSCGRWTTEGLERRRKGAKPIYGTDISKPPSELVADIRNQITRVRGQLYDIGFHLGWKDHLESVEGLLTCGLISLHWIMEEMQRAEAQRAKPAEPAPAE